MLPYSRPAEVASAERREPKAYIPAAGGRGSQNVTEKKYSLAWRFKAAIHSVPCLPLPEIAVAATNRPEFKGPHLWLRGIRGKLSPTKKQRTSSGP